MPRQARSVADDEGEVVGKALAQVFAVPREPDLADLSLAEHKANLDEVTKGIETRPLRIPSFEC